MYARVSSMYVNNKSDDSFRGVTDANTVKAVLQSNHRPDPYIY